MIWEDEVMKRDGETKDELRNKDENIKEKGKKGKEKGKMSQRETIKGQDEKKETEVLRQAWETRLDEK